MLPLCQSDISCCFLVCLKRGICRSAPPPVPRVHGSLNITELFDPGVCGQSLLDPKTSCKPQPGCLAMTPVEVCAQVESSTEPTTRVCFASHTVREISNCNSNVFSGLTAHLREASPDPQNSVTEPCASGEQISRVRNAFGPWDLRAVADVVNNGSRRTDFIVRRPRDTRIQTARMALAPGQPVNALVMPKTKHQSPTLPSEE